MSSRKQRMKNRYTAARYLNLPKLWRARRTLDHDADTHVSHSRATRRILDLREVLRPGDKAEDSVMTTEAMRERAAAEIGSGMP